MAPTPSGCGSCVVSANWPGLDPATPHDSRYLPSGLKIQNWLSNDEATHTSPVAGSIVGQYVLGWVCFGPLLCHSKARAGIAATLGEASAAPVAAPCDGERLEPQ